MSEAKFKVGDRVLYHPAIGGKDDGHVYEIRIIERLHGGAQELAWLRGKAGGVAFDALSMAPDGAQPHDAPQEFGNADYFDHNDDCATLEHTEVEDAIERALDDMWEKGETARETAKRCCPITIYGWHRKEMDAASAASAAPERALEDFKEDLYEDYGDPEGDNKFWGDAEEKEILGKLRAVFMDAASTAHIWQCDQTFEREYSFDEVMAIVGDAQ